RDLSQSPRGLGPTLGLEVESDRPLVSTHRQKVRVHLADQWRPPSPSLVAALGILDLDYARAGIAEQLGGQRAGQNAREVGDKDPFERELQFPACQRRDATSIVRCGLASR